MSKIKFKCPGCGHDLVVRSGVEIHSMDGIEGAVCSNCDRTIHKNDLVSQSRKYAENLVRDMLGKHFK